MIIIGRKGRSPSSFRLPFLLFTDIIHSNALINSAVDLSYL